MGAWLAPVSRLLTHASASLRRLDREAGVKAAQEKKAREQLNDTLGELYLNIHGHF